MTFHIQTGLYPHKFEFDLTGHTLDGDDISYPLSTLSTDFH